MKLRILLCLWVFAFAAPFVNADTFYRGPDEADLPPWSEEAITMPSYPKGENLQAIYVSEVTTHHFFVDASSLSVGKDGVVRYVLVIRTSGGATNISYEGIRCETLEYKIYATGRQDGQWTEARNAKWRPIENKPVNRQHAALSRNYFCPNRVPILDPAEGREALRLGKHPSVSNTSF
jgi:hypothetical protein